MGISPSLYPRTDKIVLVHRRGAKNAEGKYFIAFLGHRYPGVRCQVSAKKTAGLIDKENDEVSYKVADVSVREMPLRLPFLV
jgi:hypothetical protein